MTYVHHCVNILELLAEMRTLTSLVIAVWDVVAVSPEQLETVIRRCLRLLLQELL